MKQLTFGFYEEDVTNIVHRTYIQQETWLEQLEAFIKFLKAQGFHVDGRIAIVEPDTEGMTRDSARTINNLFYEQLQDVCWSGGVVTQRAIKAED